MRILILDDETKNRITSLEAVRPLDSWRACMDGVFPLYLGYTRYSPKIDVGRKLSHARKFAGIGLLTGKHSGSTGFPKAVSFQIRRGASLFGRTLKSMEMKPAPNGDRWYICMPLYHGTAFCTALRCIVQGYAMCIAPKFSATRFWKDIRDYRSTAFVYVGEAARYLLANPPSDLDKQHNVRLMWGNGMRPDVWIRFRERFGIKLVAEFFNSSEGGLGLPNVSRGKSMY